MAGLKTGLGLMVSAAFLTGCFEAQPAPDLPERLSTEFTLTEIAGGLKKPWSVAELPGNGGYLVTEKSGRLLRISGKGERVDLTGLPDDLYASGQGGLLDVVIAPDFVTSAEVYISYSYGDDDANGTALLRARLDGSVLASPDVIFRAGPPKAGNSHFGGKIVFLPDETLVLSLGDGFGYREDAQKPDTHLGKLIRISRDGSVPDDNPYNQKIKDESGKLLATQATPFLPEIYSLGHRNVQGLAFDAETGVLWEHEHGPRGGDELNQVEPGANYGWPLATKGRDYQGARISPYESFQGMVDPVHGWTPSIAPSGLVIYRGAMFPDWNGDALIGGLASRDIRRVDLENGISVGEDDLLSDLNMRVRDLRVAQDGALLILIEKSAESGDGKLLRLTPK